MGSVMLWFLDEHVLISIVRQWLPVVLSKTVFSTSHQLCFDHKMFETVIHKSELNLV